MSVERTERRIVCIGGGTGLPAVLEAICVLLPQFEFEIVALVAGSDAGGGGFKVAKTLDAAKKGKLNMPTSSDFERVIKALADPDYWTPEMEILFTERFSLGEEWLSDIRSSNMLMATFMHHFGDFQSAIDALSRLCHTRGTVSSLTKGRARIAAKFHNGKVVNDENNIDDPKHSWQLVEHLDLLFHFPTAPAANYFAIDLIAKCKKGDMVILTIGSFYTSLVAALITPGCCEAIREANKNGAQVLFMQNTMTEPGQTHDLIYASQYVEALSQDWLLGPNCITDILAHENGAIDKETLDRYEVSGARLVVNNLFRREGVLCRDLLDDDVRAEASATAGKQLEILYIRHSVPKMAKAFREYLNGARK